MQFNKYSAIGLISLVTCLISSTNSQWYNELKTKRILTESNLQETIIPEQNPTNIEYRIETFCPEHRELDYLPPTKDPNVIYFWNKTINTNKIERKILTINQIKRIS
jgi:hypothetical protein